MQRIADNSPYLDNMSEIVGLYMDTELEALRMPDTESLRQVAAKLLAALYVYLGEGFFNIKKAYQGNLQLL